MEPAADRPRLRSTIALTAATLLSGLILLICASQLWTTAHYSDGTSRSHLNRAMVAWTGLAAVATVGLVVSLVLWLTGRSAGVSWLAGACLVAAAVAWVAAINFESPDF